VAIAPDGRDIHAYRYRITIAGGLDNAGREMFEGFVIKLEGGNTVLIRDLDQAALYGALARIRFLGLELVEPSRLADGTN